MGSHRPLFLHACASRPCVSRFGSLRYWPLNSQTCLSCCCKQTVKTNLSVLILLWISVLFEQFFDIRLFKFQGWVGGTKSHFPEADPPSQNPPPGVRCEGVFRNHESVPTPQFIERIKRWDLIRPWVSCRCSTSVMWFFLLTCSFLYIYICGTWVYYVIYIYVFVSKFLIKRKCARAYA